MIKRLLRSYFAIICKNIQDEVPKAIMYRMVNYIQAELQTELIANLHKSELFDELLTESTDVTMSREEATDMLAALNRASDIIGQIRKSHIR